MTKEEFYQSIKIQLNDQQRAAVESSDGPVLLLAVPGSGKTTVLVVRLGYLILCKNVNPYHILVVTYTTAAARDMKERFSLFFGEELASKIEFRTINGICARLLYLYGKRIEKDPFRLIEDEKESTKLLSDIYTNITQTYPTESDIKGVKTSMTYIKNMMLDENQIALLDESLDYPVSEIYKEYSKALRSARSMDYDDQMVYTYNLLKKDSMFLSDVQKRYRYICVDEAQDTSKIQHSIISLLAEKEKNLFMVGDEDQSIYSWRAAYPQALLDFEKDYKNAKVLLMEHNFRSNAKVVASADSFIQKNTLRHKKSMVAVRKEGKPVTEVRVKNTVDQYNYLLNLAAQNSEETAILYRNNDSVIPLVNILLKNQISFNIRNADYTFFTHRIVKDIEDIILFADNPYDEERFMRIYFKMNLYLTKQKAEAACIYSRRTDETVLDAALKLPDLNLSQIENIKRAQNYFYSFKNVSARLALNRIITDLEYDKYVEKNKLDGRKLQILRLIASGEERISDYLNRLRYLEDYLRAKAVESDCLLTLSTIHSSKGLEYKRVFLFDVYDGIFPESIPVNIRKASKSELELYEEDRRLFYVGVTRAKDELFVLNCGEKSVFLDQFFGRNASISNAVTGSVSKSSKNMSQFYPSGKIISHTIYGKGTVVNFCDGIVTVKFDAGVKKFDASILSRFLN